MMTTPNDTHVLLRAFADELVRCGMTDVCTSPGSRSSPLMLALVRDGRLRCHSHIDERCAGFFSLGLARASGRPVAVVCTSGTAAANLAPAVIEAHQAGVGLIVLTADRPAELREVGAGQAIDQIKLFGTAAKWFFEVGTHPADGERTAWMRMLACRAYWTAREGPAGPVHLNWPLREPLVPGDAVPEPPSGRPGGEPWVSRPPAAPEVGAVAAAISSALGAAARPVIVAGALGRDEGAAVARFAAEAGVPLLADPLSHARRPGAVAHYDLLLGSERFAEDHRPDAVLRVGDLPTSKPLRAWLGRHRDVAQIALDPDGRWQDPAAALSVSLPAGAAALSAVRIESSAGRDRWRAAWTEADARVALAVERVLAGGPGPSEPWVARAVAAAVPAGGALFVASSMPIRDVEAFAAPRDDPPLTLSNRGANGIDGTVSSAYGAAVACEGPVVALLGDVAFAHDIGGLMAGRRLGLAVTFVVLNNDGGGIFEFLPVRGAADAFEEHVATPHGLVLARAADLYGLPHRIASDREELGAALAEGMTGGGGIVEVRTSRAENLGLHRELRGAAATALHE